VTKIANVILIYTMASMTSVRLYVVTTFLVGFMFKGAANFSKRVGYSKYSQVVAFKGSQINGLQISESCDMHKSFNAEN